MNTILILKSSPRPKGNSSTLANQFVAGAQQAGADIDEFNLHDMDIRPCDACDSCQENNSGVCVIGDDMQKIYPKIRQADVILISSPVYWFTLSAQAKLCIDRWYALEGSVEKEFSGKKLALILTYGDDDPYAAGAVNAIHTFQDMCSYLQAENAGVLYGSAMDVGDIEKNQELMSSAFKLGAKLAARD